MQKVLFIIVIIGAALVAAPRSASACSCIAERTVADALGRADAVFVGVVTDIRRGKPAQAGFVSSNDQVLVTFEVTGYWKGATRRTITVSTVTSEMSCGFPFEKGQNYLVYAHAGKAGLVTNLCDRTRTAQRAAEDLAKLGESKPLSE